MSSAVVIAAALQGMRHGGKYPPCIANLLSLLDGMGGISGFQRDDAGMPSHSNSFKITYVKEDATANDELAWVTFVTIEVPLIDIAKGMLDTPKRLKRYAYAKLLMARLQAERADPVCGPRSRKGPVCGPRSRKGKG